VFDRKTGVIERLSVAPDGSESNGATFDPAISSHGDFVAYASEASNLVPDDTNETTDIFVFDRNAGLVERISVSSEGSEANGPSFDPAISSDGRYVAYYSTASNLIAGDTNGLADVFVFDRKTGVTERVSGASGGGEGNGASFDPVISANGRYVTYYSTASNLVSDDTNGTADVFIFDRKTGATHRVSLAGTGDEGNGASFDPAISANGGYLAYTSDATNLVGGDTNAATDVFLAQTRGWLV
jgi:Tol biopolymer transport system component